MRYPRLIALDVAFDFKVGDPRPAGFLEEWDWAQAQLAGGLRQHHCPLCSRFFFPQDHHDYTHGADPKSAFTAPAGASLKEATMAIDLKAVKAELKELTKELKAFEKIDAQNAKAKEKLAGKIAKLEAKLPKAEE